MLSLIRFIHRQFFAVLFVVIGLSLVLSCTLELKWLSHILAVSLILKELILFVMPWLIMACAFQCMYTLKGKGAGFIVLALGFICLSNMISAWVGYGISHIVTIPALPMSDAAQAQLTLAPSFIIKMPMLLKNNWALLIGILLGMGLSIRQTNVGEYLYGLSKQTIHLLLHYVLIPLLPLFISGFFIKMHQEGVLTQIFHTYAKLTLVLIAAYASYLLWAYWLAGGFKWKHAFRYIKNVLPAGWVGFSAMSSLAALPLSLRAAQQNTDNSAVIGGILPISTNIHLVGDSVGIPLLAVAILLTFGLPMPNPHVYLIFSLFFVLAKFSVAAVPGGGILVMLPILTQYLGFTGEMSALITALYLLLDPLITAVNVLGNGAFVVILDNLRRLRVEWINKHLGIRTMSAP